MLPVGGILRMRWARFILFGMLLFSLIAVNNTPFVSSDEPHGTRSPGADVEVMALTENQTGIPTQTLTYLFNVNNTGDENDTFDIIIESENNWIFIATHDDVGPLIVNESFTVGVNVTIPMGWPAGTWDNLSFRARSQNDFGINDFITVTTNVSAMFIISIEIDGGIERQGLVNEDNLANYTLTIKNKGNADVTITLDHTSQMLPGWEVSFPDYPNKKVAINKANISAESIFRVNLTVKAPINARPDDLVTIELWAEKTDISPSWYSWLTQENITIITTVLPILDITFQPDMYVGYVNDNETLYNFTISNIGNKDVEIDLVATTDLLLVTSINEPHMTVDEGKTTSVITLGASTAKNTPQGNYSINITALDSSNAALIGFVELFYIVVPQLNISDIYISSDNPVQYEDVFISVDIQNTGFVDATNITLKFFDGENKINETFIDNITAGSTNTTKIRWTPGDFGNRSIKIIVSVDGSGNFTEHGTGIAEKKAHFEVRINWQPYYLLIYIIIVIVLGIGVAAGINELRYHSGVPLANGLGEDEGEEGFKDEYPDEDLPPSDEVEVIGEVDEGPFGTYGITTQSEPMEPEPRRPRYESKKEYTPPPKREFAPPKDPETMRQEGQLNEEISRVQQDLDRIKAQGVDTGSIDQLLRTSKKNLTDGDPAKAKQYLGYASERLKNLMAKREEAIIAIREAKEVLSGMQGSADLTIVENFLVKADSLMKEGDFREAINYAKKAKDRAQRLQRREMRL